MKEKKKDMVSDTFDRLNKFWSTEKNLTIEMVKQSKV